VPFNPVGADVFGYSAATAAQMEAAGYSAEEKGWRVEFPGAHIRCGIYEIPETAYGAPVVYIEEIGLDDVVKFTIPKTISRLPSRAFYDCDEFKYLCIKGDLMTIPKNAFPPMEKRWYTIVIRCSADCKDENGRYWKNIVGEYGAVWCRIYRCYWERCLCRYNFNCAAMKVFANVKAAYKEGEGNCEH
jgi:hypothetical protein